MAYVYRHIRLDKNEPFYIGVGKDSSGKYKRANTIHNRNNHWRDIFNKTPIEVEIIYDNLTYENALEKEMEFVKLYGRINLKTGTLCNKTDGGRGSWRPVLSQETKKRKIDCQKNRKVKVVQKDFDGNIIKIWDSAKEATLFYSGKSTSSIRYCMDGKYLHAYGFKWEYFDQERQKRVIPTYKEGKRIVQLNLNGEVVKIWDWLEQAKKAGFPHSSVAKCCRKEKMHHTCCGYKWEYFDKNKKYVFAENRFFEKIKRVKKDKN